MSAAPLSLQPAYQALETHERRLCPRYETACSALIRLTAALTFRCQVRNLSMEAAQVLCDPRYALLVHPGSGAINPQHSRSLELSVAFPIDDAVRSFTAKCRARYCEPVQGGQVSVETRMVMGLEFLDIEQGSRQLLANFLGSLAEHLWEAR